MTQNNIELLLTLRNPVALIDEEIPNRIDRSKFLRVSVSKTEADAVQYTNLKQMNVTVVAYLKHDATDDELTVPLKPISLKIQIGNIIAKQPLN